MAAIVQEKQTVKEETPNSIKGSIFALSLCEEVLNHSTHKCEHCARLIQKAKQVMEAGNTK